MNIRFAAHNGQSNILTLLFLLLSCGFVEAQYAGGNGRGDFSQKKILCGEVPSIQITENSDVPNDGFVCDNSSVTLTVSGSSTYVWSTGSTSTSINETPMATTTYTVTATSASGCTATTSKTITVNPVNSAGAASSTSALCVNSVMTNITHTTTSATGIGAATGLPPGVSANWASSVITISGTPSATGTFNYSIPLTGGCGSASATGTIQVVATSVILVQVSETSGVANNDGITCAGNSVTLGTSGGTYLWSGSQTTASITVSPSSTATYTVTVTDSNNCTATAATTISVEPLPSASVSVSETSGATSNDGIICAGTSSTLIASGGTTYSWSTGGTTAVISATPSVTTTYTVTVTNANNCSVTSSRTITVAPLPEITVSSKTDITCNGASNGSLSLNVTGGNGSPVYAWSNMATTPGLSGLSAGTYTVTVTNSGNCSSTASATISEPPVLAATKTQKNLCTGFINGKISLSVTGGTTPYSYLWSNAATIEDLSGLNTGSYTVTVTDANNCTATASATLTSGTPPLPVFSPGETSGSQVNDGNICAGAVVNLSADEWDVYNWSTGSSGASLDVAPYCTTTYTVTVSDSYGCISSGSFTVNVKNKPSVSSLSPLSGSTGTTITINGLFLDEVTQVKFNNVPGTNLTVVSPTQLTVVLPAPGMQQITLVSDCGNVTVLNTSPVVSSFTPSTGVPGTIITVSGSNLDQLVSATVGTKDAVIIEKSASMAKLIVMPGAVTGSLSVTTATSTVTATGNFTVGITPYPYIQQGSKQAGSSLNTLLATSVVVSSDGNTAVIGGPGDSSNKGAAWVYVRNGTSWSLQSKLVGTGSAGASRQGTSVAVSTDGNTVVSGGPGDNNNSGAVWVFIRNSSGWSQMGNKLTGTGASGAAQQGTSVALSADGNTLAVGGVADDNFAGALWAYERLDNQWAQIGDKVVGAGAIGKARQGASIGLSADGKMMAWGGYQDNNRLGAVWVYLRNECIWNQQGGKLVGTGGSAQAWQGYSVALSADGKTLLSGGCNDNNLAGATWVYTSNGSSWTQQARLVGTLSGTSARQGYSASLSADGNTVMSGAFGDDSNKGSVWIFKKTGGTWTQQGAKMRGTGANGPAKQGTSVSVSANGSTAIVGGPTDNSNRGAFWIYTPVQSSLSGIHSLVEDRNELSAGFRLDQNIPNPVADHTSVSFFMPDAGSAEWKITDMSGRVVLLLQREYPSGENMEVFDLNGFSGIYYYCLKTSSGILTRKMIAGQ